MGKKGGREEKRKEGGERKGMYCICICTFMCIEHSFLCRVLSGALTSIVLTSTLQPASISGFGILKRILCQLLVSKFCGEKLLVRMNRGKREGGREGGRKRKRERE